MSDQSSTPNPFATPKAVSAEPERAGLAPIRDGRLLRFGTAVRLPKICVGCGSRKRVSYADQDFVYVLPIVYLVAPFIGVLSYVFGRAIQRKARVAIPRCPRCAKSASRSAALTGPLSVGAIVFLFAAVTFAGNGLPVVGAITAIVGVVVFTLSYRRWVRLLWAAQIDRDVITLRGVHDAALAQIAGTSNPVDLSVGADE